LKNLNRSDAEPDVLAKYVHALLKDSDQRDLRAHCITELTDFLRDYTESFVDSLFEAIESNGFPLPGSPYLTFFKGGSYKNPDQTEDENQGYGEEVLQ
jgi:hypothetical protein